MTTGGTGITFGPSNPIDVDFYFYGKYLEALHAGLIDVNTYPIYVMLTNNLYVPNQDTHQFKSDVTNEINGSGYFEGGQPITGVEALYQVVGSTKQLVVTGGNLVWPAVTWTGTNAPSFAVAYLNSPVDETQQPLIGYLDFGGTQSPVDQAFYIDWPIGGIYTLTIPNAP